MTTKDEALRLADALDRLQFLSSWDKDAAAELRRLHATNQELLDALRKIAGQHGNWTNGIWVANVALAAIAKATGSKA